MVLLVLFPGFLRWDRADGCGILFILVLVSATVRPLSVLYKELVEVT